MTRVKSSVTAKAKHQKLLDRAKGFQGRQHKIFRNAKEALLKSGAHAFAGRKQKKRDFRRLWITRLSAAVKNYDLNYSQLIKLQREKNITINRKVLSEIAMQNPEAFGKIIEEIKK